VLDEACCIQLANSSQARNVERLTVLVAVLELGIDTSMEVLLLDGLAKELAYFGRSVNAEGDTCINSLTGSQAVRRVTLGSSGSDRIVLSNQNSSLLADQLWWRGLNSSDRAVLLDDELRGGHLRCGESHAGKSQDLGSDDRVDVHLVK